MKWSSKIALILTGIFVATQLHARPIKRSVAIYPLQPLGTDPQIVDRIEDLVYAQAKTIKGLRVYSRKALKKKMAGAGKKCAGDLSCLAALGKKAGMATVVYGTVATLGDSYVLDLKLIRSKNRREMRRQSVSLSGDQSVLINGIRECLTQLVAPEQFVGSLSLRLDKPGAEVYIDGDLVGKTPLKDLGQLSPGKHALKIILSGYTDFDRFIEIHFQRTTIVNVALSGTSINATIEAAASSAQAEGGVPVIVVAEDKKAQDQKTDPWASPLFLSGLGTTVAGAMLLTAGVTAMIIAAGDFAQLNNSNLVGPAEGDPNITVLKAGLSDESLNLFRDWYDHANGTWVLGQSMTWMGVFFVSGGGGLIAWDLLARPQEVPVNGE